QVMLDAVQGSDGLFCNSFMGTGNVSDWWNVSGPPDHQYMTMGLHDSLGTYSSFVVLWNPGGQWSGLTVYLDDNGAENAPFQADLTAIHYQDSAGREIDYDFSSGSMDGAGIIPIPEASVPGRAGGEETTTFLWEPGEGQGTDLLDTSRGVYTMSLPQASAAALAIPTAAITVDGAVSDWDEVDVYLTDANTPRDDVSLPGTDLEYLKLAYSPDGTRLNVLAKVADAVSQGVWFRFFFDQEDADYPVNAPGNYQVDFQYHAGSGWSVVAQGWYSEAVDPDDPYPIAANGHAAASGAYIEGSFDVAALGLGDRFYVFGTTMTMAPYVWYDLFYPGLADWADGSSAIGAWGPTAPAAADWSFEAAFSGARNTVAEQTHYTVRVGAGTWADAVSPCVRASWFTGVYGGTWYDSVLALSALVVDDINDQEWSSPYLELLGYDPLTTTVALKAEVQDGITFTAWYALNGGPWQGLWQHTISEGQMTGFPNLYPTVWLDTGRLPGPTEVEVVRGIDYEEPGTADDSYEYNVNVGGYYLTDFNVTTPWGEAFRASDYLPPDWAGEYVESEIGRLSFEAYGTGAHRQLEVSWEDLLPGEWAALDTGQTLLSVTGDEYGDPLVWTGAVDFAGVTQPTQVPTLVDPVHGQTGVPLRPEIRWEPWAAPGAESGIRILLQDDARTGREYEDFLYAALGEWQTPLPLDPATLYQVELDFVNWSGLTVNGLGINMLAMTESDPRFTTAEPGVMDASLERGLEYDYPDAIGPTRDYEVMLTGIGLTGFSLAAPWGETFDLADYYSSGWPVAGYFYDDGRIHIEAETNEDGESWIEVDWILTEAEWAALDTGDTTLLATYGAGSWGGVFDFTGLPVPADVANITSPGHEATGVGFYPVFEWDPWALPGPNPVVGIEFDECGDPESEAIEDWMGPGGTTWTVPDPLQPGAAYQFGVRFSNTGVVPTGGVDVQIAGYTDSDILFTTAEAGVASVRLLCATDYVVPGTARDDALALGLELHGYGLTGAEIVTPWGETVDTADLLPPGWDGSQYVWIDRGALAFDAWRDDGMDCLEFWWDWLSDSQWAALVAGQVGVTVDYTGGTWSQVLDFAGIDPVDQEPVPTAPVHREVEAGPLVAEWAPWASPSPGAVIEVWAWDEYGLENQDLDEGEELPASATSWVLPDLPDPTAVYGFSLAFLNRVTEAVSGARVVRETATHNQVLFVSGASVPADDHGNTSAEATPVSAPVSLGAPTVVTGTLGYGGDVDFFRFEAVAGETYEIRVSLAEGGLEDSTLWLYGSDGRTLLAWDDDGGPDCGSYLVQKAWGDGTWYLAVDAYALDESLGEYTLSIALSEKTSDPAAAVVSHPLLWLFAGAGVGAGFSLSATGAVSEDEGVVLHRLDLSDPFAPASEVGAYYLGGLEGVAFSDDAQRLYYGDDTNAWEWFGESELVAVDLAAAGDPVEVWRVPTQERDVDSLAVAGHYLYAGTQPDDGTLAYLEVYDLSDPATAVFVGQSPALVAPGGGDPFDSFDPAEIAVVGHRVYILHDGQPTISILDVSDPAAPVLVGQYVVPVTADDSVMSMAVRGNTLVLGLDGEVWFIDLSDPAAPGAPVVVPVPGGTVYQILVRGPLVFVACSQAGVQVFDLTDPSSPVLVADYDYVGASGSVAVAGGAVYVPTTRGETAVFVDETPQVVRWTGDDSESWQNGDNWSSLAVPQRWVTAVFEGTPGYQPVLYADEAVWGFDIRSAGWTVTLGQSGLAVGEGGLSIAGGASPTSTVDVGAGHLVLDYAQGDAGPLADVAAWLRVGMDDAMSPWDGQGITSSPAAADAAHLTAVGMLDNTDPKSGGKTEFAGQAVDASSVLVAYTWWGDANLDGVIDANDYDVIDKNYLFTPNPAAPWFTGDFTYDGVIDANDYDKIDKAYLFQTG
ncbi:MAG: pre-peptidase C-terminal domain-containing protein, partial [Planctomycetes bacterium]|nr:pre-peptidase C-terminal domain-containing protein [Planctomycetota bacterium]